MCPSSLSSSPVLELTHLQQDYCSAIVYVNGDTMGTFVKRGSETVLYTDQDTRRIQFLDAQRIHYTYHKDNRRGIYDGHVLYTSSRDKIAAGRSVQIGDGLICTPVKLVEEPVRKVFPMDHDTVLDVSDLVYTAYRKLGEATHVVRGEVDYCSPDHNELTVKFTEQPPVGSPIFRLADGEVELLAIQGRSQIMFMKPEANT